MKLEFSSIPCHGTIIVAVKDPNTGDERLTRVPCNGTMIPEVREIVDGVFEVRWVCSRCGSIKGAIIGAAMP
ncbi:MAG: hypothetical protein MRT15_09770 [archaeon YNP-LCB-003-016]|uniref:hypothetical protein n=1 Tax=Candidatus Culexarchaeum yellowstonense TaxID=2928963 RepID=UPI0026EA6D4A|nr:hypothetical protein [Candidatus Culexarchaeum yellowstonense]MCR6692669.1 hypothetical protein [Candidatus Culexarchaeum yellowstonense]